jgi:hypothetical protein
MLLNPPQNMRVSSNGMLFGSIISFIQHLLHARILHHLRVHAVALLARLINDPGKDYFSSSLSWTLCGNDVTLPGFTSSPAHSQYFSAPCSFQIFPACSAMRRWRRGCEAAPV